MLRCTHCYITTNSEQEFSFCQECGIGFFIDSSFLEEIIGEFLNQLDKCINSFGITKEDYEDAGIGDLYETENPIIDEAPEHPNCLCINESTSNIDFNLVLSFDDMDMHEMDLLHYDSPIGRLLSPKCKTYIIDMNERFLHTFVDDATVPIGTRNS